jgi:hypothetical protein
MPSARVNKSALTSLALLAGSLTLAGCLAHDPFAPPTDPKSAAAQQVNEAAARDAPFPRWADFPAKPKDVPTAEEFGMRVVETEEAKAILEAQARELVWTLDNTEGWATAARDFVDPRFAQPAPPDSRAQTEAWAAEMRARATPPPIVK